MKIAFEFKRRLDDLRCDIRVTGGNSPEDVCVGFGATSLEACTQALRQMVDPEVFEIEKFAEQICGLKSIIENSNA